MPKRVRILPGVSSGQWIIMSIIVIPLNGEENFFFSVYKTGINLNLLCMEENQLSTWSRGPTNIKTKSEFILKDPDSTYLGTIIDFSTWPLTRHLISLLKFLCETN